MWSYEIIFEYADKKDPKATKNSVPMKQNSQSIVSDDIVKVLSHVKDELRMHPEYDLVAIVRRNAILRIL